MKNRGSVLVGVLWCFAVLSVVAVGLLHMTHLDLRVAKNHGDGIQAHYLALAGVERAKAMIYHDAADRKAAGRNHSGEPYDSPMNFREVSLGRGHFSVIRAGDEDEGGGLVYGVSDEERRLNVNQASAEEMMKLEGMTAEVAAAIVDYRDGDQTVSQGGAEAEEYFYLRPPTMPRDAPLMTLRELLRVYGMPRDLLAGEDANLNGLLDPEEDDGRDNPPVDNADGLLDGGWSAHVTVSSSVQNLTASGEERVNIQDADEDTLSRIPGLNTELAKAIVAYRNERRFESIADLLDVVRVTRDAPPPQASPAPGGLTPGAPGGRASALPDVRPGGRALATGVVPGGPAGQEGQQANAGSARFGQEKLISEDLFIEIADSITTASEGEITGAINVNTAPVAVLMCLPGMTREVAQAIVSYRSSSGFLQNIGELLRVPGMTREMFKQLAPRITARSETFRIVGEGVVTSTGARRRIEETVRLGSGTFETLSYRESL